MMHFLSWQNPLILALSQILFMLDLWNAAGWYCLLGFIHSYWVRWSWLIFKVTGEFENIFKLYHFLFWMWVVGVFFSVCWSLHTISDILVMALRYSLTTVNMLHRFSCVRMRVCPRCAYRTNCLDFWFKKLIMQAGCKLTHVASIPDFESGQAGSFPVLDRWHCPMTCLLKLLHLQHYVHATVLCLAFFFVCEKVAIKGFTVVLSIQTLLCLTKSQIDVQKLCLQRCVFRACLNEVCESEWHRLYGRLFQVEGPTCENDLSPNAFEPEGGILSRHARPLAAFDSSPNFRIVDDVDFYPCLVFAYSTVAIMQAQNRSQR